MAGLIIADTTIIPKALITAIVKNIDEGEFLSKLPGIMPMVILSEAISRNASRKNMPKYM